MATMTVLDVIEGISNIMAKTYDGSGDKRFVTDGEEKAVGLKREEGCALNDSRVIDGFKVRFSGPNLIISYQSEMPIKSIHNMKLSQEMEQVYAGIVKFLKKEYKNATKSALTLAAQGPCDVLLQNMSRVRTWVQCQKVYKIGGMTDILPVGEPSKDRLDKNWKEFLDLNSTKKPRNVTRKND